MRPTTARARARAWHPSKLASSLVPVAVAVAIGCSSGGSSPASSSDAGAQDSSTLLPLESGAADTGVEEAGSSCGQSAGLTLDGQLDGTPVHQTYGSLSGYTLLTSGDYEIDDTLGTCGLIYADGSGSLASLSLQQGALVMPLEGPDPGGIYCTGPGSTFAQTTVNTWSLQAMVRAGACPGTGASQGDWAGCSADKDWTPDDGGPYEGAPCIAGETHLVGTLDGTAFDWQIPDVVGAGAWGGVDSSIGNWWQTVGDFGFIVANAALGDAGPGTIFGTLRAPSSVDPTLPFYCASPDSTATGTVHAIHFTLRGVTTAGACAAGASGSSRLDGCGPM